MPKTEVFEKNVARYENWFKRYRAVYESELLALKKMMPGGGGVEIGVGTGRFASPLGIWYGVEPSMEMGKIATERGISVISGVAEKLPLRSSFFDVVTMIVTLCFLDDIHTSFQEAYRVLKPSGHFLLGIIDKESLLGKIYQKSSSPFYREATLYSPDEMIALLENSGFARVTCVQTLFHDLDDITRPELVKEGYGRGSFVAIKAMKVEGS
ncbi:MAG: class I SAM-dependent methyltransferase [Euryarchaeota archaeon]|nr:class I SAM-dependent methyltransferase [Euryarchaeota archaeon]